MADSNKILNLISNKTDLINAIIDQLEIKVDKSQADLLRRIVDGFVDRLDSDEDGNIKNTSSNKQKISLLDGIFKKYQSESSIDLLKTVVDGIDKIMSVNNKFYSVFEETKIGDLFVGTKKQIYDWLGISSMGGLVENGYLNTLINDSTIKNQVKNTMFKSIVSQKGFFEVKKDLGNYIAGNSTQAGALQKYYRNFVYDTFNNVDRTQSKIIADKVGLTYAIYEGGLVKKSRIFCRERNGKVFTSEEIEKFNPKEAKPPNYNPFTDLGGYGCRHHLNYIPLEIAVTLRPDLKDKTET